MARSQAPMQKLHPGDHEHDIKLFVLTPLSIQVKGCEPEAITLCLTVCSMPTARPEREVIRRAPFRIDQLKHVLEGSD